MRCRVRFAPSPSGNIHLGNARIALLNYLFALKHGGEFLLRVDDTDQKTTDANNIPKIVADLERLGIRFAGSPMHQSSRFEAYRQVAAKLATQGFAYPCYCTDADLEKEMRLAKLMKKPPRYSGRCRSLSSSELQAKETTGTKPTWRFNVEKVGVSVVEFTDEIAGEVKIPVEAFGDFVLIRANGVASYNFASVLDDTEMGISTIIRGADHLSNTARQVLIWRTLGAELPKFAHISLLGGQDGPLSKRQGDSGVCQTLDRGYLPQALNHYLFSIGNPTANQQPCPRLEELAKQFHWPSSSGVAQFEIAKLDFFNRLYLRALPVAELADLAQKMPMTIRAKRQEVEAYLEVFKENLHTLSDLAQIDTFLDDGRTLSFEAAGPGISEILDAVSLKAIVQMARQLVSALPKEDEASWQALVQQLLASFQLPKKNLFMGIRLLLTGQTHGPEIHKILQLLGRQRLLKKLPI